VGWYERTAGIVEIPADRTLGEEELELVASLPLIVTSELAGQRSRLLTEPLRHVRADMFVSRMNPGDSVNIKFHASSLGQPLSRETVNLMHFQRNGVPLPLDGLTFPAAVACDAAGNASVTLIAADPGPNRFLFLQTGPGSREHVDGQVYAVIYYLGEELSGNPSNFLSMLVWNTFVPDQPATWHGSMKAIFEQYGNLYPYMTTRGRGPNAAPWIDMADYEQVSDHEIRQKIITVLRLAETDPHYMPVTRDLSRSRREAMLGWLETLGADDKPLLGVEPQPAPPAPASLFPQAVVPMRADAGLDLKEGSKALAGKRFMELNKLTESGKK
jgi:hypothetical protein